MKSQVLALIVACLSGALADQMGAAIHLNTRDLASGDVACVHLLQFADADCKGGVTEDLQGMTLTSPGSPCAMVQNSQGMDLSVKDQYCNLADGTFVQSAYWGSRKCAGKPEIQKFSKNQCLHSFKLASCSAGPCKGGNDLGAERMGGASG